VKTPRQGDRSALGGGYLARLAPAASALALSLTILSTPAALAAAPTPTPSLAQQLRQRAAQGPAAQAGQAAPAAAPAAPAAPGQAPAAPTPPQGLLKPAGDPGHFAAALAVASPLATATVVPSPTPSPEPTATPTATAVELPTFVASKDAVRGGVVGTQLLLEVPIRSQYDGTEYQNSNCGPTSLAMVLDAFGVSAQVYKLRNLTNVMQGNFEVESGTSLWDLASIAQTAGLRTIGLNGAGSYHQWTVGEVRDQVRRGHPVVTLVKMRDLPDHASSRSDTDHYVVVVGLDGESLLINDPALPAALGYRRPLAPDELERAWAASSMPRHAAAFAATSVVRELDLPDPLTPTPVPSRAPGVDPNPPPTALGVDPAPLPDGPSEPGPPLEPAAGAPAAAAPAEPPAEPTRAPEPQTPAEPVAEQTPPTLDGRPSSDDADARLLAKLSARTVDAPAATPSASEAADHPAARALARFFRLQLDVPRRGPWLARPARLAPPGD
jgi:hypothetical protein